MKIIVMIPFSSNPLRLERWMRALSQFGQQIIILLLKLGPDAEAIVQRKGSARLFTFEHSFQSLPAAS
jgi:hypothetical protein